MVKSAALIERVEDLGNYRLVTARAGEMKIKIKVKRQEEIPTEKAWVAFPAERCCIYADGRLV